MDNTLTPPDVYELITRSADKVGQYSYDTDGWNQRMGYGRINAEAATCFVNGACSPAAPANLVISNQGAIGENPILEWSRSSDPVVEYDIYRAEIIASTNYTKIGTVSDVTFTDTEVTISNSTNGDDKYSYKVKAIGFGSNSSFSNAAETWGEEEFIAKTSENRVDESVVGGFSLEDNYPNPFNPSTMISFTVPSQGHVAIRVTDVLGRPIATLLDTEVEAGRHQVKFRATDLTSGIYFYTIVTSGFEMTKMMFLQK